jgi:hypothetical protein
VKPYLFLLAGLIFFPPRAQAQVVINQAALDQLAGIPPVVITAPPVLRAPSHKIAYRPRLHRRIAPRPAARLASSRIVPQPVPPRKPSASAPPILAAVARPVLAKPAPPPSAAIIFASGASDLPAGIAGQLKPFCADKTSGPITIDAYAAADPSDPSAALRLSMSRAFALRDALTACGIASASIIARADGANGKNPDRAVISAP